MPTSRSSMCICLVAALAPGLAAAALSERVSSTQADAAVVKGSLKVQTRALYDMHEIQMTSGTVVHEFADRAGLVFAVAWNGPTAPDLRQLLGKYFERYVAGAKGKVPNHRRLEVNDRELVV